MKRIHSLKDFTLVERILWTRIRREIKEHGIDYMFPTYECGAEHGDHLFYIQPTHWLCAYTWSYNLTKALLDVGADVNKEDTRGQIALGHAINQTNPKVIDLLIQRGSYVFKEYDRWIIDIPTILCTMKHGMVISFWVDRTPHFGKEEEARYLIFHVRSLQLLCRILSSDLVRVLKSFLY